MRMVGRQQDQKNHETDGCQNYPGAGEAAPLVKVRTFIDLRERDDGKNQADDVEWKSAAAPAEWQG